MSRILISILLLLLVIQIPAKAASNNNMQLEGKFNQFADEVNCRVVNYLQNSPDKTIANKISCINCSYDIYKEQIKNSKNKKIAEYLNGIKIEYCNKINSGNVNEFIDRYINCIIDTIHGIRSKQSNFESWKNEIILKKDSFKADIKKIITAGSEIGKPPKSTHTKPAGIASPPPPESLLSKVWNYLKYPLLILIILIFFVLLIIEYKNLIRKINERDKEISELRSELQSANRKLKESVEKGSDSFVSSKNSQSKAKTNNEILEDAILKLKHNPLNVPSSTLISLIDSKRNAWLDRLDSAFKGKFNIKEADKAQFIIDFLIQDVERIVKEEYYDLKKVTELLEVQNILEGQEWLKKYKKVTPENVEKIARVKANELQTKLPNNSLISKAEFDKLKSESLREIEVAIREEEANMDTVMYSSQPVGDGYFIREKLSDEILGQHMYKILISAKNPDTARFQFLFDNEKAMKTAIASYSTALVPVCILERDNTKGERIVPSQENAFGTLRLENDRWKVQEKLRIRIV